MNELTIMGLAVKCLPALLVVVILLELLIEEYLRLMELAGLARRRSSVRSKTEPDNEGKGPAKT